MLGSDPQYANFYTFLVLISAMETLGCHVDCKRARVHIGCSFDRKTPSPILMGEGGGEGNFITCGVRKIMKHFVEKSGC